MASQTAKNHSSQLEAQSVLPTFMDHIRELQGRLFSIAITFVVVAATAYPFFDKIANIILAPLKKGQDLVYLTPGGAFSFIIKVCMYIGVVGVLPVIIYHVYRFVMPVVKGTTLRRVLIYTIFSAVLAAVGLVFAYYVSLPASLYFLTSFNLYHINPMLTIDSYFSFVMTYLLAGALLFQLPIVMLIINTAHRMKPKRLMNYQRHIIVGSFVIAAVISPTPDALNQALLASPMVAMYQFGIIMVWLINRRANKRDCKIIKEAEAVHAIQGKTSGVSVLKSVGQRPVLSASLLSGGDTQFESGPVALTQRSSQRNTKLSPQLAVGQRGSVCISDIKKPSSIPPPVVRRQVAIFKDVDVASRVAPVVRTRHYATPSMGTRRQSMEPVVRTAATVQSVRAARRNNASHIVATRTFSPSMHAPRPIDGIINTRRSVA